MATVYTAFDMRLEREVAIKVIRTDMIGPAMLEKMLKRFEREAKSLAKMNHRDILNTHDFGEHEGAPYLVMEYMRGGTLKERTGKPMRYQDAAALLLPIARALAYTHQRCKAEPDHLGLQTCSRVRAPFYRSRWQCRRRLGVHPPASGAASSACPEGWVA